MRPLGLPHLLAVLLPALACGVDTPSFDLEPALGVQRSALLQTNGVQLNGVQLNGVQLNGVQLNGVQLNGVQLNGVQLNGVQLNGIWLDGSQLRGYRHRSCERVAGGDMQGATFSVDLSNEMPAELRIDSARVSDDDPTLWFYRVSVNTDSGWVNICQGDLESIAVPGRWSADGSLDATPGYVTFGCRTLGAIAKCVEMGYAPWKKTPSGESLRAHHQACTRMVRADYCGDGVAHTADGNPINVFDALGIQTVDPAYTMDQNPDWRPDAEWTEHGAVCMTAGPRNGATPSCQNPLVFHYGYFEYCGDPNHFSLAQPPLLMNHFKRF
jgi:hypothetical protein